MGRRGGNRLARPSIVLAVLVLTLSPAIPLADALLPEGPRADFELDPANPSARHVVRFTSTSTSGAPIVLARWDFGDGATAMGAQAEHAFANHSAYLVTLRVVDALGREATVARAVAVQGNAPVANFTMTPSPATRASPVRFADASFDLEGDAIVARAWDFGDGWTSAEASPTHTYAWLGPFVVRLVVRDSTGMESSASATLDVVNGKPVAEASMSPATPRPGESVTFRGVGRDTDTEDGVGYFWSFSDGVTATTANVTRAFDRAGPANATLVVADWEGARSDPIVLQFTVEPGAPQAAFAVSPAIPNTNEPAQFSDASTSPNGDLASWMWDFGDSTSSTEENPQHTYRAAGAYVVALRVTDEAGMTASTFRNLTVNAAPVAAFNATSPAYVHADVAFSDRSTDEEGDALAYAWSFGDGATSSERDPTHAYDAAGLKLVTLTVTDTHGASSSSRRTIQIVDRAPTASFVVAPAPIVGAHVSFDASGTTDPDGDAIVAYAWSFGDNGTAVGIAPTHVYAASGVYDVTLRASDGTTWSAPAIQRVVVNADHAITLRIAPRLPDGRAADPAGLDARAVLAAAGSSIQLDVGVEAGHLVAVLPAGAWTAADAVTLLVRDPAYMDRDATMAFALRDADVEIDATLTLPMPLVVSLDVEPSTLGRGLAGEGAVAFLDGVAASGANVTVWVRALDVPGASACEAARVVADGDGAFSWSAAPACASLLPGRYEVRAVATYPDATSGSATREAQTRLA